MNTLFDDCDDWSTTALLETGSFLKPVTAGDNSDGQLGLGDNTHRGDTNDETGYYGYDDNWNWVFMTGLNEMGDFLPAVSLGTGLTATEIMCGFDHTCALLSDGQLKCWGGSRIFPCPRCQGADDTSLI